MFAFRALILVIASSFALSQSSPGCKRSSLVSSDFLTPKFQQSRANINGYSKQTIELLIDKHGTGAHGALGGGWVAQNGVYGIAGFDFLSKTSIWKTWIGNAQKAWCDNAKGNTPYAFECINAFNDDIGWAALANVQAYEAYGEDAFLDRAKRIFDFISQHGYIKQSDLDAGVLQDTKASTNTLRNECDGKSMLGGVYWMNGAPGGRENDASRDGSVAAVSTGLYAWTGAKLCHHTKDNTYCDQAYSSLQWIDRHLVTDSGLIMDHVIGSTCKKTDWIFTYNAGLYIGAYADLHRIRANETALALARKTALASMSPTAPWNGKNGIIKEGQGPPDQSNDGISFKAVLIRGLHSAIDVFPDDVQASTRQYINIQYYAIANLASNDPKRPVEYGRNWTGPAFQMSTSQTLIAALDVLNGLFENPDAVFPGNNTVDRAVIRI